MAKICLTSRFVQDPPKCPSDKGKMDYYDTQLPGFLLEVRASGRATYYQSYRDKGNWGQVDSCLNHGLPLIKGFHG